MKKMPPFLLKSHLQRRWKKANYPYSTEEYRDNFRHSLWMVPGVKEAKALSKMLKSHPVFDNLNVVNVAGDGEKRNQKKKH